MAGLRKIGRVHYSDVYFPGHPKAAKNGRLRIPLDTDKAEAEAKLGRLVEERNASKFGRAPKSTTWSGFKARITAFLERKSRTTRFAYRRAFKLLEEFRPIQELSDVTPHLLDELYVDWKMKLKRPLFIRNKDIKCLTGAMRKAESWGLVRGQDWETVEADEEPRGRLLYYEIDKVRLLRRKTTGIWQVIVMLGARAGLRRGEMRWLHRHDVDFTRGLIHIDSKAALGWTVKNFMRRSIPMVPDLRAYLKKVLADGREWVLQEGDWRPTDGSMTNYFARITRRAGLKGSIVTLRHTFAAHLAIAGRSLLEIRDLMGHKSTKTTEIYAHLRPGAGRSAIESLPAL